MVELLSRVLSFQRQSLQEVNHDPSPAEIAKKLGVNQQTVEKLLRVAPRPTSLQLLVGDDNDTEVGDLIEDPSPSVEQEAVDNIRRAALIRSLEEILSPRELEVIVQRFGLDQNDSKTLEEIGFGLGVSRERVRQIEAGAFKKLRSPDIRERFRDLIA